MMNDDSSSGETSPNQHVVPAMIRNHLLTLVSGFLVLSAGTGASAGEMKMELNSATDAKLLTARFGRYGHQPMKTIATDAKGGMRFQLPGSRASTRRGCLRSSRWAGILKLSPVMNGAM